MLYDDSFFELDSTDNGDVIPNLSLDIVEAIRTGIIDGKGAPSTEYNGLQETSDVGPIIRDNFDFFKHDAAFMKSLSHQSSND